MRVGVRVRVRMVHLPKFTADQLWSSNYLGLWNPGSYLCTVLPNVGISITPEALMARILPHSRIQNPEELTACKDSGNHVGRPLVALNLHFCIHVSVCRSVVLSRNKHPEENTYEEAALST
jgi:hypothetical protein